MKGTCRIRGLWSMGGTLNSIHNLAFYVNTMARLRDELGAEGKV